jgi:hypothetical protein
MNPKPLSVFFLIVPWGISTHIPKKDLAAISDIRRLPGRFYQLAISGPTAGWFWLFDFKILMAEWVAIIALTPLVPIGQPATPN